MKNKREILPTIDDSLIDKDELIQKELDIVKAFIALCEKHHLRYYAAGGTCLGAIRHQGFIPWDDDMDLSMPRSDYDKFLQLAPKELPGKYFVQTYLSDPDFREPFAKIRDSETTFVETYNQRLEINHGIWVDIFPIDGIPNSKCKLKRILFFKKLVRGYVGKDYYPRSFTRKVGARLCQILLFTRNTQKTLMRLDKKCKKYPFDKCEKTILYGGTWGLKEIHSRSTYEDGVKVKFENLMISVPKEYDTYLKELYGDYMKLPPKEQQVGRHLCSVCDLKKSYKEYRK